MCAWTTCSVCSEVQIEVESNLFSVLVILHINTRILVCAHLRVVYVHLKYYYHFGLELLLYYNNYRALQVPVLNVTLNGTNVQHISNVQHIYSRGYIRDLYNRLYNLK